MAFHLPLKLVSAEALALITDDAASGPSHPASRLASRRRRRASRSDEGSHTQGNSSLDGVVSASGRMVASKFASNFASSGNAHAAPRASRARPPSPGALNHSFQSSKSSAMSLRRRLGAGSDDGA